MEVGSTRKNYPMFKKRSAASNTRKRVKVETPVQKPAVQKPAVAVKPVLDKSHVANLEEEIASRPELERKAIGEADATAVRLKRLKEQATKHDRLNSEPIASSKKIQQAANLRNTILTDFQPDVCKDFKQTGYCGYGDSCKFLHSRDDFKAGWTLATDWKIDEQKEETKKEAVPFKCVLCKESYERPVKTNCGHYFCQKCFVNRIKIDKSCFICGENTEGIAKMATDLVPMDNANKDK